MAESITLEVNTAAPVFRLEDIFGRQIDLKAFRGKKVLVAFFRHAGCPFCNSRVHRLQKVEKELKEKGLEMIFFFESTEKTLQSHTFHKAVNPTPLISDPDKIWYQTYGVENSAFKSAVSHLTSIVQIAIKAKMNGLPVHMMSGKESINTIPAEFLIDKKGVVKKVHYARSLTDELSVDIIRAFAES